MLFSPSGLFFAIAQCLAPSGSTSFDLRRELALVLSPYITVTVKVFVTTATQYTFADGTVGIDAVGARVGRPDDTDTTLPCVVSVWGAVTTMVVPVGGLVAVAYLFRVDYQLFGDL